ncbi:hypothetical protein [Marinobacter goseongensis]|uniref:hypothetical protein n=1 Tax=Marinobacter goseongensis TaxID=453838 RepID=UPI0020068272|nr:hypothetical protein [Marinobacter goseongensis]MCK7551193.1 hypothetical protein [Marinobacter goseongensis]
MSSRIDLRLRPESASPWFSRILCACNAVTRLKVEQGQLYAGVRAGEPKPVSVANESRIGRHLTLLKIRSRDARSQSHLVVLVDFGPHFRNVASDEFRRLRMWLRLGQTRRTPASTT